MIVQHLILNQLAVVGYGYGDYVAMRKGGKLCTLNNPIDISLFGTSFPTLEQMESASPCRMVSENTPPMFLWCTSQDELVPSEQTLIMGIASQDKAVQRFMF